jgi:hypothetical protein
MWVLLEGELNNLTYLVLSLYFKTFGLLADFKRVFNPMP